MLYHLFGVTYGGGTYDSSTYSSTGTTSTGTSGSSSGSGVLTNTGFDVLAAATLACTIIFVSLIVRFWRRRPVPVKGESAE